LDLWGIAREHPYELKLQFGQKRGKKLVRQRQEREVYMNMRKGKNKAPKE